MFRILCIVTFLFFAATAEEPPVVVVFGDSLSAGYNLPPEDSFVSVLSESLTQQKIAATVVGAAVPGDTSFNAVQRLDWMLMNHPDVVIIEFGANDMLRGFPPPLVYDNLNLIIKRLVDEDVKILLAGMLATANMGEDYAREFADVYQRLAAQYDIAFLPFFLDGVALREDLNLPDGIHPNAAGVRVTVDNILPLVIKLLKE